MIAAALGALGAMNAANADRDQANRQFQAQMAENQAARDQNNNQFRMTLEDKKDERQTNADLRRDDMASKEKIELMKTKSTEKIELANLLDRADARQEASKNANLDRKSQEKLAALDFAKTIGAGLLSARSGQAIAAS